MFDDDIFEPKYVHIHLQQRTARKSLTIIQGLDNNPELKKILKAMKKTFVTNGTIVNSDEMGAVVQLQGDQRKNVAAFLVKYNIRSEAEIKIHGF